MLAQMSRPALYLIFSSKEEVLRSLVTQIFNELLCEVREGLSKHDGVADKLTFAFEVWCVRSFEMIQASPDAKDILESGYEFAAEITLQAFSDFENILSDVLRPIMSSQAEKNLSSDQLAHILATAVQGLKESATSVVQRSEEHTSELQSHSDLVCRLLLEKKKKQNIHGRHFNVSSTRHLITNEHNI